MAIWYILTANLAAAVFQTAIPSAAEVQEAALLQVEKGQLPLVISAPHGGLQSPEGWEVRTNGVVVRDTNTYQIAESLADAIQLRTGQRPFLVLSKVHRKYLDLNRSLEESGGKSSPEKRRLWNTYHESIERACQQAMTLGKGRALLIDLHGQGHKHGKIELGYGLRASELRQPDSLLPRPGWLRGPQSLGAFLQAQELQCMPSPAHLFPLENEKFFSGGYTIRRHRAQGGLAGSEIGLQAIQIELPPKPRRGNAAERQPLADRLAQGISLFLAAQFSIPKVELLSMAIPNDGPMAVFQSRFS